jgi:D-aspartate ligase
MTLPSPSDVQDAGQGIASLDGERPPALVVGMCVHGLAVIRALSRAGVKVYAVEQNASLPGTATSKVVRWFNAPIGAADLVETLLGLANRNYWRGRPVLFLMNDRMVRVVADAWGRLAPHYRLSWAASREEVVRLQSKDRIPEVCRNSGVRFPATTVVMAAEDCLTVEAAAPYPLIVKPAMPMGDFKAIIVQSRSELIALAQRYAKNLPFVVQQWIPGGPSTLKFCSLYLIEGRSLARFEGRKGYAGADGLGQGTVMEPWPDDRVYVAAMKFLEGLELSGPVSVEFKEDPSGHLWLIEPNVGRTEYCVDVCVANGFNLPIMEYQHAIGAKIAAVVTSNSRIWCDTDRDKLSWIRFAKSHPRTGRVYRPAFPYLRLTDLGPFFRSCAQYVSGKLSRPTPRSELVADEQ